MLIIITLLLKVCGSVQFAKNLGSLYKRYGKRAMLTT